MKKLAIIVISLATAFTGVAPAQAFTPGAPGNVAATVEKSDIVQVRDRHNDGPRVWKNRNRNSGWSGRNRFDRHDGYSPIPRYSSRNRYDGNRYYHGNRYYGDRYYGRRYYRNDAGAIIGGLAAGAIIGGALAQPRYYYSQPRVYTGGNAHIRSCYARYRSYRASDNTYQPNYGPRRQCR